MQDFTEESDSYLGFFRVTLIILSIELTAAFIFYAHDIAAWLK